MAGTRKAKQFLVFIVKLLIVGGAFYFIYERLSGNSALNWHKLTETLQKESNYPIIGLLLLLTFLNRFVEIVKWQNLASYIKNISLGRSAKEVLAAVTVALFTPNGIGEYAAKAMYYKKNEAGEVIFLNLICNGIQLVLTIVGGLAGLALFGYSYPSSIGNLMWIILAVIIIIIILLLTARKITIKGYSLQRLGQKIDELPKNIHRKNIALGIIRYLTILHQYYLLFLLFDVELAYGIMIATIAATYLLGSSLPSFQFLDFAVKGSVAIAFFGTLGVNEWIVVFTATLIWLLNTVLPVTIGSYFVFTFRTESETITSSHQG